MITSIKNSSLKLNNFLYVAAFMLLMSCKNNNAENETQSTAKSNITEDVVTKEEKTDAQFTDSVSEAHDVDALKNEKDNTAARYICFTGDGINKLQLWISMNAQDRALQVKYEGQSQAIDLALVKQETEGMGAYPTIAYFYNEIIDGKVNGTYKHTHSGNWDYLTYTRGRDGKIFKFTVNHALENTGKSPCFKSVKTASNIKVKTFKGISIESEDGGCYNYFNLSTADPLSSGSIFVDDLDSKAAMNINGFLETFTGGAITKNKYGGSNAIFLNGSYKLTLKTKEINKDQPTYEQEGTLTVETLDGADSLTLDIVGSMGC